MDDVPVTDTGDSTPGGDDSGESFEVGKYLANTLEFGATPYRSREWRAGYAEWWGDEESYARSVDYEKGW